MGFAGWWYPPCKTGGRYTRTGLGLTGEFARLYETSRSKVVDVVGGNIIPSFRNLVASPVRKLQKSITEAVDKSWANQELTSAGEVDDIAILRS